MTETRVEQSEHNQSLPFCRLLFRQPFDDGKFEKYSEDFFIILGFTQALNTKNCITYLEVGFKFFSKKINLQLYNTNAEMKSFVCLCCIKTHECYLFSS